MGSIHYVNTTLANAFHRRIGTKDKSTLITLSVRNYDNMLQTRFCTYPEISNYLIEKFATGQAIDKIDAAIPRYMQPTTVMPESYIDDIFALFCRLVEVYGEKNNG